MRATTPLLLACTLLAAAGCSGTDTGGERRLGVDAVVVGLPGALERPAVLFDHGKHLEALEKKCDACHPEAKPGELSFRTVPGDGRDALLDGYHAQCRGCHARRAKAKLSTGPTLCGDCHVKQAAAGTSQRRHVAFAGALHDKHLEIADKDCGSCHHHAAPGASPMPCRACHDGASSATKEQPSLKDAYHQRCVGCHHTNGMDEGCAFCHERATG